MRRFLRNLLAFITALSIPFSLWARGGGGCFEQGTPVATPKGPIPIERLQVGDLVRAYDRDGQIVTTKVRCVIVHQVETYYVLSTAKMTVNVTAEHPFFIGKRRFKPLQALKPGELIYVLVGNKLQAQPIQNIRQIHTPTTVYNLQTDEPHTYFAAGIAVHNKGGEGGGGASYGGGSGFSYDYSGRDNGSSSGLFIFLIFLVFMGIGIYQEYKEKNENLDFSFSRKTIERKSKKTVALLDFLAKQDMTVTSADLLKRVRFVFLKLQECWQAREYTPMEAFLMSDLYLQHYLQISSMIRNHEINRLSALQIHNIDLVNFRYTEKKEQREFTALVTATARDFYVDDRTHTFLRGDEEPETFQEFWTFQFDQEKGWLLREVEQARESDYLKEENFVEQFTDLQIEKIYQDKVDNLGAAGPGLEKDVEIKANKVERMLNFLVTSDKLWNKKSMLSRVSAVFTSVHLALEAEVLDARVEAQLFPEVAAQFRERVDEWRAQGMTIEYRNFCIRKIEIVLVKNFNDKTQNEFTARVTAHAQRILKQDGFFVLSQDNYVTPFTEYWSFGHLDNEWKLKEVLKGLHGDKTIGTENVEEDSSLDLIKWYYSKKRAL